MPDFELAHRYDTVNLHRRAAAVKLELNRPERMNAWDRQLGLDLLAALTAVGEDATVRAVQVTAEAVLERVSGNRLEFSVSAHDPAGPVGAGRVTRVVVETAAFLAKAR